MGAAAGEPPVVAGVELGGTKSLVVLARGPAIIDRLRVPTLEPAVTLAALSDQVRDWRAGGQRFAAIGIAAFGPIGLDRSRDDFGHITSTPKAGWRGVDVRGHFAERFDVPIGFDTDTAGAALAERAWGAAPGCDVVVYLTIGTGLGGGIVVGGRPVHGLVHPEVGHLRVRRRAGDPFPGVCPFHGDCIEGLVSGPAIAARAGAPGHQLDPDHPVWDDVAAELAELLVSLILTVSPQRIVVGGGVASGRPFLFGRIHPAVVDVLAGYVTPLDAGAVERLIVPPTLGDDAGPLGAAALALEALAARDLPRPRSGHC